MCRIAHLVPGTRHQVPSFLLHIMPNSAILIPKNSMCPKFLKNYLESKNYLYIQKKYPNGKTIARAGNCRQVVKGHSQKYMYSYSSRFIGKAIKYS